jgi:hypothetical protein
MNPKLENLLKRLDQLKQTPPGPEADRLLAIYEAEIEEMAQQFKIPRETLRNMLRYRFPRWVRANLPPEFPKELGSD